jgi:DNA polymerase I-like protein with 3'-5' exonuclease and polymerase domains
MDSQKINPKTSQAYNLLHQGTLALARAERQGIRVDVEYIQKQKQYLTKKIEYLENKFKQSTFYKHWTHITKSPNINSNPQLAHFLYDVKKIKPVFFTDKSTDSNPKGSTDEEALKQLNIPELNQILEIRKLKKVRDTYLDAFEREQVNGYIHPFFNLHLVRTFRSSADSPNFQNIPIRDKESMKICRQAIYPRPGHQLLEVDFSGLEVRIAACYHKDQMMLKYIKNPASDMHKDMAEQIFKIKMDKSILNHNHLRQAAKNGFVFPEFYGDYYKNCAYNMTCIWGQLPQGRWKSGQGIIINDVVKDNDNVFLSDHLISQGIKSFDAFEKHMKEIEYDFWNNRFSEYQTWKNRWYSVYKKYGYIDLLTGFRCSGVMNMKEVINYPVQGSAFHCLLWSLIELDKIMIKEKWDTKIIGQIHDSVIMDVNPDELSHIVNIAKRITTVALPKAWDWIIVPLDVDMVLCPVDGSWAEKKKYEL